MRDLNLLGNKVALKEELEAILEKVEDLKRREQISPKDYADLIDDIKSAKLSGDVHHYRGEDRDKLTLAARRVESSYNFDTEKPSKSIAESYMTLGLIGAVSTLLTIASVPSVIAANIIAAIVILPVYLVGRAVGKNHTEVMEDWINPIFDYISQGIGDFIHEKGSNVMREIQEDVANIKGKPPHYHKLQNLSNDLKEIQAILIATPPQQQQHAATPPQQRRETHPKESFVEKENARRNSAATGKGGVNR
ncbi:MAG: hypothetical protein ACI8ZF_000685 [Candidatus Midichloriaceae bacterium]|jgi:hypothetical protein